MKSCKWEEEYIDWVPVPFGSGNCPMSTFDCIYEGDIDISEVDECDEFCPAYEEYSEEGGN